MLFFPKTATDWAEYLDALIFAIDPLGIVKIAHNDAKELADFLKHVKDIEPQPTDA